jgi:hypothetical protein
VSPCPKKQPSEVTKSMRENGSQRDHLPLRRFFPPFPADANITISSNTPDLRNDFNLPIRHLLPPATSLWSGTTKTETDLCSSAFLQQNFEGFRNDRYQWGQRSQQTAESERTTRSPQKAISFYNHFNGGLCSQSTLQTFQSPRVEELPLATLLVY